jgi:hypothetical protein
VARLNTDGTPDNTFDSDGKVITSINTLFAEGSNRITINMADLKTGAYTPKVRGVVTNEQLRSLKR